MTRLALAAAAAIVATACNKPKAASEPLKPQSGSEIAHDAPANPPPAPAQPAQPTQPAQPAQPVQPAPPVTPVDPAKAGVELAGPQLTLTQISDKTCPRVPPQNGSTADQVYVPDGPARAYIDKAGKTRLIIPHIVTYPFIGDDLENAKLDCTDAISVSRQDGDPAHLDDTSWPWAFYRLADDRAITLYHMEYHAWDHPTRYADCTAHYYTGNCPWLAAITLGIADDGIHFSSPPAPSHVVARPPVTGYPRDSDHSFSDHSGIMKNPKDGKYYVAFLARGAFDGDGPSGTCMMRTDDLTKPNSWKVFTGNGYDGDGSTGTRCTGVLPTRNNVPGSLAYSDFYGTTVYLTFADPPNRGFGFYMHLAKDDSLTKWSDPILVAKARLPWGTSAQTKNAAQEAYPSFLPISPTDKNFDRLGEEAWLYWVRWKAQDTSGFRDVMRVRVRFSREKGEIKNATAPMKGFYRVGGGGYMAAGDGTYCTLGSMAQLHACGWPGPFEDLGPYDDHGGTTDKGKCPCG